MADSRHPALPGGPEYYLKTPEEMSQLFHWCPEAIQNTVAIAERCNVIIPTAGPDSPLNNKPLFQLPSDFTGTHDDYLRKVCKSGLKRRYGIDADASSHTAEEQRVLDRMERELVFITSASLSNDFLVVWDLLWDSSKEAWRWYNIGRGPVCSSLVAYLMPIHDVDPLRYNLLFERFLNEEYTPCSYYDMDGGHDTCNDVVFQEAQKRYGAQNVARRLEIEPVESDTIVMLVGKALGGRFAGYGRIADIVKKYWTVKGALEGSKKLQRLVKSKAWAKEIVETSIALERIILEASSKFSGIIIGGAPLLDACAVDATGDCGLDSFLDNADVQNLGMLEIGRWGMDRFVEDVFRNTGDSFQTIPPDIPEAFALLVKDDDSFYCDTRPGERLTDEAAKELRRLVAEEYGALGHFLPDAKPRNIEELATLYAICRPGPMEFLGEYFRRRSGEAPVIYETPELEPILKETYGIILYQEQFMQIINVISGLSLGKADRIRRSLGRRMVQKTKMWHGIFFEEASKRGFGNDVITRIWEKLQYHSLYCYQKAHAVARAILLYRIAFSKANLLST